MAKVSELNGRAVIGLEHAQKLGSVHGLVIDPNSARVVGLKINRGPEDGGSLFLPSTSIYSIGPDAITVREAGLVERDAAQIEGLEQLPSSSDMGNTKVVTDRGTLLGSITDIVIDDTNLQILGYELDGSGWGSLTGRSKVLPAQPGYRYGGDLMLVPDAVASGMGQAAPANAVDANQAATINNAQTVQNSAVVPDAPNMTQVIRPDPKVSAPATDAYGNPVVEQGPDTSSR